MHNAPHAEFLRTSLFKFNDTKIRTATKPDGSVWFVVKDIGQALGYSNPRNAARRHVADDDKGKARLATASSKGISFLDINHQMLNIINENGMYSLLLRSRQPQSKQFKRWVTAEVLPSRTEPLLHTNGTLNLSNGQYHA